MNIKLISIIIATYNANKTIERCLNSIIQQKDSQIELIIVDGKSTDGTIDKIRKYIEHIDYFISESDNGIYDAWNKALKHINGEWVMFLGADDELRDNAISKYLEKIKNVSQSCLLISSKRLMIDAHNNKPIYITGKRWTWPECINGMQISHPGALHRRILFSELNGYNLHYKICSDYEFLMRKGNSLNADFMNEITVNMSTGGMSDSYEAIKEYYQIILSTTRISKARAMMNYVIMLTKYTIKHILKKIGITYHA